MWALVMIFRPTGAIVLLWLSLGCTNGEGKKDHPDNSKKIQGIWEHAEEQITTYEFRSDEKYISTTRTKEGTELSRLEGIYVVIGNEITVTVGTLKQKVTIVELSDHQMTIRLQDKSINRLKKIKG